MEKNTRLIELYLDKLTVTTASREILNRGGTIAFTSKVTVSVSTEDDDGQPLHLAKCGLELRAVGTTDDSDGSAQQSMEMVGNFVATFRINKDMLDVIDAENKAESPATALYLASITFSAVRHHFVSTLDMIGVTGYRLPWHLEPETT